MSSSITSTQGIARGVIEKPKVDDCGSWWLIGRFVAFCPKDRGL